MCIFSDPFSITIAAGMDWAGGNVEGTAIGTTVDTDVGFAFKAQFPALFESAFFGRVLHFAESNRAWTRRRGRARILD
jgi:hypothetical protein